MGMIQLPKLLHPDFTEPGVKPRGPVEIDWDNQFGKHTQFCGLIRDGKLVDIVSGQSWALPNATIEGGGNHGQVATYYNPSAEDAITLPTNWDYVLPGNAGRAANMLVIAKNNSTTSGDGADAIKVGNNNNDVQMEYTAAWNNIKAAAFANSFWSSQYTMSGNSAANFHTFMIGLDVLPTFSDMTVNLHIDGVLRVTSTETGFHYINSSNPVTTIHLGGGTLNKFSIAAIILFGNKLDRLYTDAENGSIGRDPYQILKPSIPLEAFYGSAAAAASGTLLQMQHIQNFNKYMSGGFRA